jgi:hypothetical protein
MPLSPVTRVLVNHTRSCLHDDDLLTGSDRGHYPMGRVLSIEM